MVTVYVLGLQHIESNFFPYAGIAYYENDSYPYLYVVYGRYVLFPSPWTANLNMYAIVEGMGFEVVILAKPYSTVKQGLIDSFGEEGMQLP